MKKSEKAERLANRIESILQVLSLAERELYEESVHWHNIGRGVPRKCRKNHYDRAATLISKVINRLEALRESSLWS